MLEGFLNRRDNPEVRQNVCVALAEIDDERADRQLFELAVGADEIESVRETAVAELVALSASRQQRVITLLREAVAQRSGDKRLKVLLEAMLKGSGREAVQRAFGTYQRWRVAWTVGMPSDARAWLTVGWPGILAAGLLGGALAWLLSVLVPALAGIELRQGAGDWIIGAASLAALWHALAGRRRVLIGSQLFPLTGLMLEMLWNAVAGAIAMGLFLLLAPHFLGMATSDRLFSADDTAGWALTSEDRLRLLGLAAAIGGLGRGVSALGAVRWRSVLGRGNWAWMVPSAATLGLVWGLVAAFLWLSSVDGGAQNVDRSYVQVILLLLTPAVTALAILASFAEAGGATKIEPAGSGTAVFGVGAVALGLVALVVTKVTVDSVSITSKAQKERQLTVDNLPFQPAPIALSLADLPATVQFAITEAVTLKLVLTASDRTDLEVVVDPRESRVGTGGVATFDDPESGCTDLKPGQYSVVVRRYEDDARSLPALAELLSSRRKDSQGTEERGGESSGIKLQLSLAARGELRADPICVSEPSSVPLSRYRSDATADIALGRIERGVVVNLSRPVDLMEGPSWNTRMDELLGRNLVVTEINPDPTPPRFRVQGERWGLDVRWITKLTPPADAASSVPRATR